MTIDKAYHPYLSSTVRWVDFAVERGDLCAIPIAVYKCPSVAKWPTFQYRKDYFGCTGARTVNPPRHFRGMSFIDGVFWTNSYVKIGDISDGTSTTMAVGESVHPHPWGLGDGYGNMSVGGPTAWWHGGNVTDTAGSSAAIRQRPPPVEYLLPLNCVHTRCTPNSRTMPPFGSQHTGGAQFIFCDGHAMFLTDPIDMKIYGLATRATARHSRRTKSSKPRRPTDKEALRDTPPSGRFRPPCYLTLLGGCGDGLPERGKVTGKVTFNGKPVPEGTVTFYPETGRSATGRIQPDGTYTLTTFDEGDGAIVGPHEVTIEAVRFAGAPQRQELRRGDRRGQGRKVVRPAAMNAQWLVPEKYAVRGQSGLTREVKSGTNTIDFTLP